MKGPATPPPLAVTQILPGLLVAADALRSRMSNAPPVAGGTAAVTGPAARRRGARATAGRGGYRVQLNDAAGPVGALRETPDKTLTVTGLTAGKAYTFTVNAQNGAGYGAESAKSAPFTPTQVTDQLTIATAKWKAGDFRVTGTASVVGKTVSVRTGLATRPRAG